jgi:TolB-like protein/Tfp pilus assembly protein PilF
VFISYASQDSEVAGRISEALRAAGVEVWFDQSELRGGDAWDASIRKQIKACALFIPLISANTHARVEGYFRLEWKLAVDRSHLIAPDQPFLVPVVIDETPQADERIPDRFRDLQWSRLVGGEASPAFVERVARLLSPEAAHSRTEINSPTAAAPAVAPARRQRLPNPAASQRLQPLLLLIAALAVIGVGYFAVDKFVLSKRSTGTQDSATGDQSTATARGAIPEKSIAVLPFIDMSEKKDQQYFADGMAEELIDMLAQIRDLQVIARTSSFYFKGQRLTIPEIARKLGVAHILEGSVRRSGDTVRVTVQLIRADSDLHQWSQTYDRSLKDVFQVQDDIAAAVVSVLKLKLLPAQQIQNPNRSDIPEAYDQYLLGRQFEDRSSHDGYSLAAAAYGKAIELDPSYAAAYAGLAAAQDSLMDFASDPMALQQQALRNADKAVTLAPDQAVGYVARGSLRLDAWNWPGARADFEKALSLDDGDISVQLGYASLLAALGQLPEAIVATKKVTELDPLSAHAWRSLGRLLTATGDFAAARAANRRALNILPNDSYALNDLGRLQLLDRHPAEALATFQQVTIDELRLMSVAIAEHALGHAAQSQQALNELIAKGSVDWAYQIAEVFAWRGENDKAFEWLNRAYEQRDPGMAELKNSPLILLSGLPRDPRYRDMLRKMKLPD